MAQTKSIEVMDGSRIKALVNDTRAFASYVDAKFCTLDKSKNGRLSREELMPIALAVGNALGLPPQGSSPNADHIYDEVLSEFLQGQKESITKEEFTPILRDMLLGVADGLERDPVMLRTLNGEALERYVKSTQFETDAVQLFSEMAGDNDAVNGDCIKGAIQKMSVEQGMPPASDGKILKGIVEPSLQSVGTNGSRRYTQDEFMKALRQSLNAIASWMREKPVTVAHTEKCFDGSAIATLLKDEPVLQQILNDTWKSLGPFKSDDGMLLKSNIRIGLDLLGPYAGLPPVGAVDEVIMNFTAK
ncbi:hypothetical protein KP509_36G007300 [Ceratopteris richardii]|uniref:EF-hand domain-containing protein n=1 Tax=Ceratopteris richardii TaxID=49495 RepID=A0A8T2QAI5_CERRI|nr:hypothetical protein KP509_36G007300 [Ceratopteris richardii]